MKSTVVFTKHARRRMSEYGIAVSDVRRALLKGNVIRTYSEDRPYKSRLLIAYVDDRPIHVVAADADDRDVSFVITVYVPDPNRWENDFKTKRRDE